MNIAVKLYSSVSYCPSGMPPNWPAEVIELRPGKSAPEGWLIMTTDEYQAYREQYMAEYLAWAATQV